MTELIFRDDAYARSCEATVIAVTERGIVLDRTVFYPTGGGQPGDTGVLRCEAGTSLADVLNVAVPAGYFLPVTPGTKFVTVGGAVTGPA